VLTATLRRVHLEQFSVIAMNVDEIGISVVLLVLKSAPHDNKKQRIKRIGLTPELPPAAKWLIIKGHNQWPKKAKLFD
jgi:hypothetical protein